MKYVYCLIMFCLTTSFATADDLERNTITSCAYQAGTAYEIQKIRQTEGDDWATFENKINSIYKDTQGRDDLLAIGRRVYIYPVETSVDKVHEELFQACVKRQQGTEPLI
ncbi:MAG TPA: hypothetical protein EYM37_09990 [Methylophaga aminisulfidivorans]|jgi:hypothetical protein|uniref:hypothetical protein n=1 Tax=Methylophaga TaxID=40222 RepID=UPI00177326CD|nr:MULTISPECIES: hypothetical protein [Methylophaga]HIC45419.1 hypothetical protein [Methylophaga sp.]HIM40251.1 hypothetical protein [Methylophaga aminisulfidivorans]